MCFYDLLIKNARIIDGCNNPWFRGDILVNNGKIVYIGSINSQKISLKNIINAKDLILSPGFIDIHTHSDFLMLDKKYSLFLSKLKQGVTTQFIGQCGVSAVPIKDNNLEQIKKYTSFIRGSCSPNWNWNSISNLFKEIKKNKPGTNVGSFVGHGSIRLYVMGFDNRKANDTEIKKMKKLIDQALSNGAFGLTSGLIYPPGIYSDKEELIEISKILKKYNSIYLTHMRSETDKVVSALREAIDIAQEAKIPVQISHHKTAGKSNWNKTKTTLDMIENARKEGVDITIDQYPYTAASTNLKSILPPWVHEGNINKLIKRLKTKKIRDKIIYQITNNSKWENMIRYSGGPKGVKIIYAPETPEIEGLNLLQIGEKLKIDPIKAAFKIIIKNKGSSVACFFSMSEDDVRRVLKSSYTMVGSDSIPSTKNGNSHPRTNGTFPRILGKYVRDEDLLNLEEAIWKMTGFPAARLNLKNKGVINEGYDADIVIFDPEKITDKATYDHPNRKPVGINYVIINGKIVIDKGQYTGTRAGQIIKNYY